MVFTFPILFGSLKYFLQMSSYGDIECASHTKIHVFCYSIRIDRIKMKDFWEEYSNQLEDHKFRRYYRMDKCTFGALTSFLNPKTREYQGGRVQVTPHKMVAMTLFFLGSKMPFWQLSGLFGISEECFI